MVDVIDILSSQRYKVRVDPRLRCLAGGPRRQGSTQPLKQRGGDVHHSTPYCLKYRVSLSTQYHMTGAAHEGKPEIM